MRQGLGGYCAYRDRLARCGQFMVQAEVDDLLASRREREHGHLPKGVSVETLDSVVGELCAADGFISLSATEMARIMGASRVTARRYLEYLADTGLARRNLRYEGGGGRPEVEYQWRQWPRQEDLGFCRTLGCGSLSVMILGVPRLNGVNGLWALRISAGRGAPPPGRDTPTRCHPTPRRHDDNDDCKCGRRIVYLCRMTQGLRPQYVGSGITITFLYGDDMMLLSELEISALATGQQPVFDLWTTNTPVSRPAFCPSGFDEVFEVSPCCDAGGAHGARDLRGGHARGVACLSQRRHHRV